MLFCVSRGVQVSSGAPLTSLEAPAVSSEAPVTWEPPPAIPPPASQALSSSMLAGACMGYGCLCVVMAAAPQLSLFSAGHACLCNVDGCTYIYLYDCVYWHDFVCTCVSGWNSKCLSFPTFTSDTRLSRRWVCSGLQTAALPLRTEFISITPGVCDRYVRMWSV